MENTRSELIAASEKARKLLNLTDNDIIITSDRNEVGTEEGLQKLTHILSLDETKHCRVWVAYLRRVHTVLRKFPENMAYEPQIITDNRGRQWASIHWESFYKPSEEPKNDDLL